MAIIFKYKSVKRPDGTLVKTPSIPVVLQGKTTFKTIALLDSGADISAMPKEVAEILGLDLSGERSPAFGIGGETEAVETTVSARITKGHEDYKFKLPVKVIFDDYNFPMLLGRAGFFDKFIITFNQQQEKVVLKRVT